MDEKKGRLFLVSADYELRRVDVIVDGKKKTNVLIQATEIEELPVKKI